MPKGRFNIKEDGKATRFKPIGTRQKMGSKVFGFRVPEYYQNRLNQLNQEQRIKLIREAVIEAIDKASFVVSDEYENN